MMYVIFNNQGAIKEKQINEWIVQGSNNTNKIGVVIEGTDSTSYAIIGVCKLPNGEVITTTPSVEQAEIKDGVYGVVFSLTEDITALAGTLRINLQAINVNTDKVITSYTVFLCVNEGVDPGEILMMTAQQYQNLISKIELDVQNDETILTFNTRPEAENYSLGQIIYVKNENKLYECVENDNEEHVWHETFDFNNYYTKAETDDLLNEKQNILTEESLETAQLQYAIGFDSQGNLRKGQGGGGGGATYTAGTGIDITDYTISIDDTVVATKTFVSDNYATKLELQNVAEIAEGKSKAYVINTQSQITGTKDSDDNYTNVTAITGITLTDLHLGDIIYIKELNVPDYWVSAMVYNGDVLESISLNKMETSKVDLSQYYTKTESDAKFVDLDSAQTITGQKTFSGAVEFGSSGSTTFRVGPTIIGTTNSSNIKPRSDASYVLGDSNLRYLDGYFAGQVYAENTNNVINASDIVNNTLSQAQFDLITNGKPTLISGSYTYASITYKNMWIEPLSQAYDNAYWGEAFSTNNQENFRLQIKIPTSTKRLEIYQTGFVIQQRTARVKILSTRFIDINATEALTIQGKAIPAYPSDTTKQYKFVQKVGGNLDYVEDYAQPYATNSTTTLQYETINNISISADTTYTLATAPIGTYPEYKGYISNSSGSAKVITLPTSVTKIKASSSLTVVQPTISGGSVTVAGTVSIPDGAYVEFNLQNGLIALYNWNEQ